MAPERHKRMASMESHSHTTGAIEVLAVILAGFSLTILHDMLRPGASIWSWDAHEKSPRSLLGGLLVVGLCAACGALWRSRKKFGHVFLTEEIIEIHREGRVARLTWEDVAKYHCVSSGSPAIHRLSFKNGEPPVYFALGNGIQFQVLGWRGDFLPERNAIRDRLARDLISAEPNPVIYGLTEPAATEPSLDRAER